MQAMMVYVTASSCEEAAKIGRVAVEKRLAACANVLGDIRSFYWWDGKIQDDSEAALILKTTEDRVESLVAEIKALHSYTVPCVVALPIGAGNPAFLEWIGLETR